MFNEEVIIPGGKKQLNGSLHIPEPCAGLVLFAHGSGSSRFSSRNRSVAGVLNRKGIATFLFDLLTPEEDHIYENRFNIPLIAQRLVDATLYLASYEKTSALPMAYFGASTGAAAAVQAAAQVPEYIYAVVSRGGRVDLAEKAENLKAPLLLLVGEHDEPVLSLNRSFLKRVNCKNELVVIKNATHLFEEAGALEEVSERAAEWFLRFLKKARTESKLQSHV